MRSIYSFIRKPMAIICLIAFWGPVSFAPDALAAPDAYSKKGVKHIPPGAQKVNHGRMNYFFHKGRFYKSGKGRYGWVMSRFVTLAVTDAKG